MAPRLGKSPPTLEDLDVDFVRYEDHVDGGKYASDEDEAVDKLARAIGEDIDEAILSEVDDHDLVKDSEDDEHYPDDDDEEEDREEELIEWMSPPRTGGTVLFKSLFISDIHMSNKLPYALPTKDGMTDRLEEQVKLWDHVYATLEADENIASVFILGDLFDKPNVDPVTMTTTVQCISKIAKKRNVYILAGNHDSNSVKGGRFATEAFGAFKTKTHIFTMKTGEPMVVAPGVTFWAMDYGSLDKAKANLESMRKQIKAIHGTAKPNGHILLMHHSVNGCEHGGWTCDDGLDADEVVQGFDTVLTGHFHDSQNFGPDLQGMYLGAPMHHRFDDVGRGAQYWVISFRSGGDHIYEPHDPGLAKFYILDDYKMDIPREADASRRDFIRWRIRATRDAWDKKYRAIVALKATKAQELGFRADYILSPIRSTIERLSGDKVGATEAGPTAPRPLEDQIAAYVELVSEGAAKEYADALVEVGRKIMAEARHAE